MDDLFSDAGLARYDELRAKSEALLQNKSAPQPSSGHSGQGPGLRERFASRRKAPGAQASQALLPGTSWDSAPLNQEPSSIPAGQHGKRDLYSLLTDTGSEQHDSSVQPKPEAAEAAQPAKPARPRPRLPFLPEDLGDLKLFQADEEAEDLAAENYVTTSQPKSEPELGVLSTDDIAAARHKVSINRGTRAEKDLGDADGAPTATVKVEHLGHGGEDDDDLWDEAPKPPKEVPGHKGKPSTAKPKQEPDSDTAVPAKPKRSKAKKPASPDPSETQLKPPTPHSGSEGPASGSAAQQQQGEGPTSLAEAVVAPEFQLEAGVVAEEAARPLVGSLGDGCQEPLLLHHTSPGPELRLQAPGSINSHLRSYQRAGVKFLFRQYAQGQGGILGDDMGLGKTVQTIAFLAAVLGKTAEWVPRRWPILIVCPNSVMDNWAGELSKWGTFHHMIGHGRTAEAAFAAAAAGRAEVVTTTYDTLRTSQDIITSIDWHLAFFDEAHKLKNQKAKLYGAALRMGTKLRYGLTGTAMQNEYKELYALLDFMVPSSLGSSRNFMEYYAKPLQAAQSTKATHHERKLGQERQEKLLALLQKYMLKRMKKDVLKDVMPDKSDRIVFCRLSELQLRIYRRVLHSPEMQAMLRCSCGSGLLGGNCCLTTSMQDSLMYRKFHFCECSYAGCKGRKDPEECKKCPYCLCLPCLTLLRKVSNHLNLVKVDEQDYKKEGGDVHLAYDTAIAEQVFGDDIVIMGGARLGRHVELSWELAHCGKLQTLRKLLLLWHKDVTNKMLIFSSSVRMLNVVEVLVIHLGYSFKRLDGSTPINERQRACHDFNRSSATTVFLISTNAGGLGINLQGANKVVIVDPSWNPASDLQAQDRAFRLGQNRNVSIWRLIATGTIEEQIYTRQIYKQQQSALAVEGTTEKRYFEGVQKDPKRKGELWGLENLLKLTEGSVRTQGYVSNPALEAEEFHIEEFDAGEFEDGPLTQDAAMPHSVADGEDRGLVGLLKGSEKPKASPSKPSSGKRKRGAEDPEVAKAEMAELEDAMGILDHGPLLGTRDAAKDAVGISESEPPPDTRDANKARSGPASDPARPLFPSPAKAGQSRVAAASSSDAPQRGRSSGQQASTPALLPRSRPGTEQSVDELWALAEFKGLPMTSLASKLRAMSAFERRAYLQQAADQGVAAGDPH